jgi:hypothetical protein
MLLTYQAHVTQRTGEDWCVWHPRRVQREREGMCVEQRGVCVCVCVCVCRTRVRLSLSTSQPAAGGDVPSLTTEVLGFYDPEQRHLHMQHMAYAGAARSGATRARPMMKMARMAADGAEMEMAMDNDMMMMADEEAMPEPIPMMEVSGGRGDNGPGGLTREVETPLPSNSPHDHMILRR